MEFERPTLGDIECYNEDGEFRSIRVELEEAFDKESCTVSRVGLKQIFEIFEELVARRIEEVEAKNQSLRAELQSVARSLCELQSRVPVGPVQQGNYVKSQSEFCPLLTGTEGETK